MATGQYPLIMNTVVCVSIHMLYFGGFVQIYLGMLHKFRQHFIISTENLYNLKG